MNVLEQSYTKMVAQRDYWMARAEAAEKREATLREALGWYADIDEPVGNLARAALEAKP